MAIATRIPRYNKLQKLFIDNKEITLIDHLKQLRIENKITKKKISNIIKQNDTWYSQIERNGKNGDDNRQKTIYRPDLINIISIIKYGANSIEELGKYRSQSEVYIDKVIKATPLEESLKTLEWYEINNRRSPEIQDKLFESLMTSINASIRQTYTNSPEHIKNMILSCLKEINSSLKIDTCFLLSLAGLPFSEFLYEADQDRIDTLINNVMSVLDKIDLEDSKKHADNKYYFTKIVESIQEYVDISKQTRRNTFEFLPPDKIEF